MVKVIACEIVFHRLFIILISKFLISIISTYPDLMITTGLK